MRTVWIEVAPRSSIPTPAAELRHVAVDESLDRGAEGDGDTESHHGQHHHLYGLEARLVLARPVGVEPPAELGRALREAGVEVVDVTARRGGTQRCARDSARRRRPALAQVLVHGDSWGVVDFNKWVRTASCDTAQGAV
nr:hypothetical protein GCM10025730_32720 [Promicromonospora thailandica]